MELEQLFSTKNKPVKGRSISSYLVFIYYETETKTRLKMFFLRGWDRKEVPYIGRVIAVTVNVFTPYDNESIHGIYQHHLLCISNSARISLVFMKNYQRNSVLSLYYTLLIFQFYGILTKPRKFPGVTYGFSPANSRFVWFFNRQSKTPYWTWIKMAGALLYTLC